MGHISDNPLEVENRRFERLGGEGFPKKCWQGKLDSERPIISKKLIYHSQKLRWAQGCPLRESLED